MSELTLSEFDGVLLEGLTFCTKTYDLFEKIRALPDGTSRLRMRPTEVEKKLLEELMPIAKYVQDNHRPGRYFSVEWHGGNQGFDAKVFQRGSYVCENYFPAESYFEITCAVHENDHLMKERLDTEGSAFGIEGLSRVKVNGVKSVASEVVGYTNLDFIDKFLAIVVQAIENKRSKTYPTNTTLIVQCRLNTAYLRHEWDLLMTRLAATINVAPFREIYLYDPTAHYSHALFPKPAQGSDVAAEVLGTSQPLEISGGST